MSEVQAKFDVDEWDEVPFDEGDGTAKLTAATVTKRYTGDVDGSSVTKWVMAYRPDGTASFVGMERITGTVDGREGTLVLEHVGSFADGAATAALTVVSGTGELEPARGTGKFRAAPAGEVSLDLTYGGSSDAPPTT